MPISLAFCWLKARQGEQTTLPKGPLSLDGVFERRDKPKLKHLALFLFPDRLLCASVSELPHYRIKVHGKLVCLIYSQKELLALQDLEVVDLPDSGTISSIDLHLNA